MTLLFVKCAAEPLYRPVQEVTIGTTVPTVFAANTLIMNRVTGHQTAAA